MSSTFVDLDDSEEEEEDVPSAVTENGDAGFKFICDFILSV